MGPRVPTGASRERRRRRGRSLRGVTADSSGGGPRSLPLILSRELAANLSTPMFLIDAEGTLVYCNEAAELMLGRSVRRDGLAHGQRVRDDARASGASTASRCGGATRRRAERSSSDSPPTRRLLVTAPRRRAPRGRVHRVPAVRPGPGDARRAVRVLGGRLVRVKVWGCRGSLAVPGSRHRPLRRQHVVRRGPRLGRARCSCSTPAPGCARSASSWPPRACSSIHVLLSHLHLDHLQGLGFFRPLFDEDTEVHIWGPASPVQPLAERIATYLSPPLFPVRLADIPANVTFHDAPEEPMEIGGLSVRASLVTHQGPTVGYRVEEGDRSVVYLPDHEPGLGVDVALQPTDWLSGYELDQPRRRPPARRAVRRRRVPRPHRVGALRHRPRGGLRPEGRRRPAGALPPRSGAHRRSRWRPSSTRPGASGGPPTTGSAAPGTAWSSTSTPTA